MKSRAIVSICSLVLLLFAGASGAQDIPPGIDLFSTPSDGSTHFEFPSSDPIPADFFGPGSDPFEGIIALRGNPAGLGNPAFGSADTIVERLELTTLPACPSEDTINVQIVALSLVSIDPITVTYFGGMTPELWDVHVCLSDLGSPPGPKTIRQECPDGGTFDVMLPVLPKFVFVRVSDTATRVLDYGLAAYPPIELLSADCPWVYSPDPSLRIVPVPPGESVDGNCDGSPDPPLPGTSNFFPCVQSSPCDACSNPPGGSQSVVRCARTDVSLLMVHTVEPAREPLSIDILPGLDLLSTPEDGPTYFDLTGTPIPADFFGPGSDPFDGIIYCVGDPGGLGNEEVFGLADTIVERLQPASVDCGSATTIDIQIVALSLVSTAPITVTYNGGMFPEEWEVRVCLSETSPQPIGTMIIGYGCPDGGAFSSSTPVLPRFIFSRGGDSWPYDFGEQALPAIEFSSVGCPWVHSPDASLQILTVPPGESVGNCDGIPDMVLSEGTSNFFPCIQSIPCNDCDNPPGGTHTLTRCTRQTFYHQHVVEAVRETLVLEPGINLFATSSEGSSYISFASDPLPSDFFGPGSDPFDGIIALKGYPAGLDNATFETADTIVERLEPAMLVCGSSDTIDIEIVALSLVSTEPITVTYAFGDPELWDVRVCLSSDAPQTAGTMTIEQECPDGGEFNWTLPILPKFVFTRQSDMMTVTWDYGGLARPPIDMLTYCFWVHPPDPCLRILPVPAGESVDGNCDAVPDPPLPGTTDLALNVWSKPCDDCGNPPGGAQSVMTCSWDDALMAGGIWHQDAAPVQGEISTEVRHWESWR